MKIAVARGRKARPDLKLGICGEHGGDPASIAFCDQIGPQLRQLLPLPRPDRPPCRGAGGAGQEGGEYGVQRASLDPKAKSAQPLINSPKGSHISPLNRASCICRIKK